MDESFVILNALDIKLLYVLTGNFQSLWLVGKSEYLEKGIVTMSFDELQGIEIFTSEVQALKEWELKVRGRLKQVVTEYKEMIYQNKE